MNIKIDEKHAVLPDSHWCCSHCSRCCLDIQHPALFGWRPPFIFHPWIFQVIAMKILREALQICEALQIHEAQQICEALQIHEALQSWCSWLDLCLFPEEKIQERVLVCYYTFREYWMISRGPGFRTIWLFPHPSPLPSENSPETHRKTEKERQLTVGGGGGGRSQITRQRESLVLYNSFKTLWL